MLGVEFILSKSIPKVVQQKREEALSYRKRTQPLRYPSAGSIFRNPVSVAKKVTVLEAAVSTNAKDELPNSAGQILELLGLKGVRKGGVEFSKLHANWIVKVSDDALASDVLALIELAQEKAKEEFGIMLKPELCIWP